MILPRLFELNIVLLMTFSLSACSFFTGEQSYYQKRKNAYLAAEDHPDLVVPAGLSRIDIADHYKIPSVSGQPGVSILPPGSLAANTAVLSRTQNKQNLAAFDTVIVDRVDQVVLSVGADIKQVWPAVGTSLVQQKIKVLDANEDLYKYYILRTTYMAGTIQEEDIYQIHLIAQGDNTVINITDYEGKPLGVVDNKGLLRKLMRGLNH